MKNSYDDTRERGVSALEEGRHEEALEAFQEALQIAEEIGETERTHAARCNVSLALWQLGRRKEAKQGLREIILASREDRTVAAAALWISAILTREHDFERAQQYLRIARERARDAGDLKLESSALIELGNIRLNQGDVEDSLECYRESGALLLELPDHRYELALNRKNEGYALALLGNFREAFEALREARDLAEKGGNPWVTALVYQDQAYAYLLRNHLRRAEKASLKAVTVSRQQGYVDVMKNAYFILMEVAIRQDETAKFDIYFDKLQELLPDVRLSRSFFRMFDITDILNLREV